MRDANPGKKGPFSFGSLSDPPTMAGITVLVMKGGHDERVERGGEGGARQCGAGGTTRTLPAVGLHTLASNAGRTDVELGELVNS